MNDRQPPKIYNIDDLETAFQSGFDNGFEAGHSAGVAWAQEAMSQ